MILHFEIDQEVNNCKDCIFSYLDGSFGECWCKMGHGIVDGKITERLAGRAPMIDHSEEYDWSVISSIPDWCPCVKVDDEEYNICEYYREQDGRCRATRDYEWEGCSGDRSKCPHHKIKVLQGVH